MSELKVGDKVKVTATREELDAISAIFLNEGDLGEIDHLEKFNSVIKVGRSYWTVPVEYIGLIAAKSFPSTDDTVKKCAPEQAAISIDGELIDVAMSMAGELIEGCITTDYVVCPTTGRKLNPATLIPIEEHVDFTNIRIL